MLVRSQLLMEEVGYMQSLRVWRILCLITNDNSKPMVATPRCVDTGCHTSSVYDAFGNCRSTSQGALRGVYSTSMMAALMSNDSLPFWRGIPLLDAS